MESEHGLRHVQPEVPPATDRRSERISTSDRSAGATMDVWARVSITPWTDPDFADAVRQALQEVRLSPEIVFGSGEGAILAERLLRDRGYAHARVIDARDVDQAMRRVARWLVLRDG